MKWILLPLAVLLVTVSGCTCLCGSPGTSTGNQPPTAYIDSITPSEASAGQRVSLHGHGTDRDGTVVGYSWRSDMDGVLSSSESFDTNTLSTGMHTLYFKVQDNTGDWSDEVRAQITISGAAATSEPVINSFKVDPGSISPGGYTILSWDISGATSASIDQEIGNVALNGTMAIAPAKTTTYILTAQNATGTTNARARVLVSAPPLPTDGLPKINLFSANPLAIPAGAVSTLTWSVADAIQVSINPIIGNAGLNGSTNVSPNFTTLYTLVAWNGAGASQATVKVVVQGQPGPAPPPQPPAQPQQHTVTLKALVNESGYVQDNGVLGPQVKYALVGDDKDDHSLQGFLSFDISGIPANATINDVIVDFSNVNSIAGDPFGDLGCLRGYVHDYGALDPGDYFAGSPSGAIIRHCNAGQIVAASDEDVRVALQSKVGNPRFQIRLQFNEKKTDNNGDDDSVVWKKTVPDEPKLIVTYTTP